MSDFVWHIIVRHDTFTGEPGYVTVHVLSWEGGTATVIETEDHLGPKAGKSPFVVKLSDLVLGHPPNRVPA